MVYHPLAFSRFGDSFWRLAVDPMPGRLQQPWMHVKLGFVVLLIGYEAYRGENVR